MRNCLELGEFTILVSEYTTKGLVARRTWNRCLVARSQKYLGWIEYFPLLVYPKLDVGTADTDRLIGAGIVADDTVTSSSMNRNICLNPIFPPLVTTFVVSGRSWSARWFSI